MDYDIGCTILCKVHLELNIYPFGNVFFGFEKLECRFQIFILLLPSFSNGFEYNATIFDSLEKKLPLWFPKKSIVMCFYPKLSAFLDIPLEVDTPMGLGMVSVNTNDCGSRTWHWASPCWGSNLSSTPCGFGTHVLTFTTRKHGTFLLQNLVKKYPIWTSVKKTTSSFWTSQFWYVYCDSGGFLTRPVDWSSFC